MSDQEKPGETKSEPPVWHAATAIAAAAVLIVLGAVLLVRYAFDGRGGFSPADWAGLDARLKFAALVTAPMIVLGGVAVLVGVWMAIVEWRGRFRTKPASEDGQPPAETTTGAADQLPKIIEAVGKLQGAALVLVVGALMMFAAAWIAQSATGAPGGSATPSPGEVASPSPS